MGIAIQEFKIAMENLGAKRLLDREIRFNLLVPCYEVNGVLLIHSGTDFVIHKCTPFSMKVMKLAKFKLGKRQNDIINLDEIRSLYGLLLFSLLLENKFNENTLRKIFNETYKKVLKNSAHSDLKLPQYMHSSIQRADMLHYLIKNFDNAINPFTEDFIKIKDPYCCLNDVSFEFISNSNTYELPNTGFAISNSEATTEFIFSPNSLLYYAEYLNDESKSSYTGYTSVRHYYTSYSSLNGLDEIISINICNFNSGEKSLNISLNSGLAWATSKSYDINPVTDTQIDYMIDNLAISIARIKKAITNKVIF